MSFRKEIEQSLEQIQVLSENFRQVRDLEMLPLSFFSNAFDILKDVTACLHELESTQFKRMEAQLLKHEILAVEEIKEVAKSVRSIASEKVASSVLSIDSKESEPILNPVVEKDTVGNTFLVDAIGKRLYPDLKNAFSLNDRFRFQRDLFRGNADLFNANLEQLNAAESLNKALALLDQKFQWNWEDDSALAFRNILEKHFL